MGSEVGSIKRKRDQVGIFRTDVVVHVSPRGSDSNAGLSESTPFRTVKKAFAFLKNYTFLEEAKVTIRLAAGVYKISETLVMDHPQSDRITLEGSEGLVSGISEISSYTDTTSYVGRVGSSTYKKIVRSVNENGVYDQGQRYNMTAKFFTSINPFPQSLRDSSGKYVVISPLDSSYEIPMTYNTSSIGLGSLNDNTDVQRYDETQVTLRRFYGYGAQKIKSNTNDVGTSSILLDNRIRNINPWTDVVGAVTNRNQSLADPRRTTPYVSPNASVPVRYVGTTIQVIGDITALKIDNATLTIKDLIFEGRDPSESTATPLKSEGILVTDSGVCKLGQGIVVANFDTGIRTENKSLLTQTSTTMNPYQSVSNCKTGILICDGSSCVLNGVFVTGCWNDGIVVNGHSDADLSSCAVIGCGRHGYIATRNSDINANRCMSLYNVQNSTVGFSVNTQSGIGFGGKLNSNIECVGCLSFRNGYGYYADKNGSVMLSSSDSRDNMDYAVSIAENANSIIGPFFHSEADAAGVLCTDSACCKVLYSKFNNVGFDTVSGEVGSCFTVTAMGNVSTYDVAVNNYAKNCFEGMYNSIIVGDGITISEHANTSGDSCNVTYGTVIRLSNADLGARGVNRYSLQNGTVEINGVQVNE